MKRLSVLLAFVVLAAFGCRGVPEGDDRFGLYIESWERISFESPLITRTVYSGWHSKPQAEAVFASLHARKPHRVEVMIGKALQRSDDGLEAELDGIQKWLLAQGIETIVFRLATSDGDPPIVREFRDGQTVRRS